jgi:hypothetical protein
MIYTAPCVMFLMRADTLGGEVGGWGWRWKYRVLWAPVKLHEPIKLIFVIKKSWPGSGFGGYGKDNPKHCIFMFKNKLPK